MTYAIVAVLVVFLVAVAYLFGRYWLGYRTFRGHLRSIKPSAYAGIPDIWFWGLSFGFWADFDPSFHFTNAGIALRIGPFVAGANLTDSN